MYVNAKICLKLLENVREMFHHYYLDVGGPSSFRRFSQFQVALSLKLVISLTTSVTMQKVFLIMISQLWIMIINITTSYNHCEE